MSPFSSSVYELAPSNGSRHREIVLFEEEDFSPEAYVLDRLRHVEEEEETPRNSAVFRNFCACIREREVHYSATNTKNSSYCSLLLNDTSRDGQELRVMIAELKGLQRMSAKEMIKSMISHYALFIKTSREVTDLEEAILKLRTLLRSRAAAVRSLATMEWTECLAHPKQSEIFPGFNTGDDPIRSKLEEDARALPDILDVLLAERKVDLVLSALERGEEMVDAGYACTNLDGGLSPVTPITAAFLHIALSERRARLTTYLSDICQQPSVRGVELRSAIAALNRLGEGTRAHTLLLLAHNKRLEHNTRGLRPSGTSFGGAFTAALSQMTFSAIAQARRDAMAVFGAVPAYASELVVWARDVTELYAGQIKQHVLSSAAAAGGLQAAAECVQIAFGHCSLLEAQGLAMCPLLAKVFRSSVEQAMEANLKRIEESVTALASADNWNLTFYQQTPLFYSRLSSSLAFRKRPGRASVKLSCSAHKFSSMAQDFMAGVSPLVSMQLAGVALEGLSLRFENYVDMLIKAVPDITRVRPEQTASTDAQRLTLLSNAIALAHDLLPCSAFKLLPGGEESCERTREETYNKVAEKESAFIPGLKDWQQKLVKAVKRLQDHICIYNVKLVLYSADRNELQLTPAAYLALDEEGPNSSSFQQNNMPSLVFQLLFSRLNSITEVGKEMAFSNEGVVTPFLERLLEVFVSYMDEDNFWSIIEDGPRRIGPIGLKKFVMDMQFVIQMATSSGCSCRSLSSIVRDLTSRAVQAYAATGADPESVLPSDYWFLETAHKAIENLTERRNQMSIFQDPAAEFSVSQETVAEVEIREI